MSILISPSILSADFSDMGNAVKSLETCGADWVHCDVMDGVFVPNISFGQKMVADISRLTSLVTDVHLMIVDPIRYITEFVKNGADMITFHLEATDKVEATIQAIRQAGASVGIAIKPNTPVKVAAPFVDMIDMLLIMSVEPGFSGQSFLPRSVEKIREAKLLVGRRDVVIQVDGGILEQNAQFVIDAGADCLVAGNAVFKAENKATAIKKLRGE